MELPYWDVGSGQVFFANVRDQVSLLASGAEGAQAASVTEVPQGQGLDASLCSDYFLSRRIRRARLGRRAAWVTRVTIQRSS